MLPPGNVDSPFGRPVTACHSSDAISTRQKTFPLNCQQFSSDGRKIRRNSDPKYYQSVVVE